MKVGKSPHLNLFLGNSPALLSGDDGQLFLLQRQRSRLSNDDVYWLEMYEVGGARALSTLTPTTRFAFDHGYVHLLQAVRRELHGIYDIKSMLKEIKSQVSEVMLNKKGGQSRPQQASR